MTLTVDISDEERDTLDLRPDTIENALSVFTKNGCVVLKNCYDLDLLERAHEAYNTRYGEVDLEAMRARAHQDGPTRYLEVGDRRFEIVIPLEPPFNDPRLYGNPLLLSILTRLLGDELRINSFTIVTSYPGSELQHIHRDHWHLFESGLALHLPAHAINVAVPLIDVDLQTGPTGVWPGSHRWLTGHEAAPEDVVGKELVRGDCLLLDYRTLHAGMPNNSQKVRPNLYMVYSRPWFNDEINHITRNPIEVPLSERDNLPEPLKKLLTRAWTLQHRAATRPSEPPPPAATPTPDE